MEAAIRNKGKTINQQAQPSQAIASVKNRKIKTGIQGTKNLYLKRFAFSAFEK